MQSVSVTVEGRIAGVSPWDVTLWFATPNPVVTLAEAVSGFQDTFPAAILNFGNIWTQFNDNGTLVTGAVIRGYEAGQSAASVQATVGVGGSVVGNSAIGGAASQACCSTLYTAHPGKSGRGRLYWPATSSLGPGYQFPDVAVSNLAIATKNLYQALAGWAGGGEVTPMVGVVRSLTLGTANAITSVACNSQPDRQEHRERHLTFTRHQTSF